MKPIQRVLIATASQLLSESLSHIVARQESMQLVGTTQDSDIISLLLAVRSTDATVIILTDIEDGEERDAVLSHLFAEVPGMTVLCFDEPTSRLQSYRQRIISYYHEVSEIHQVISVIDDQRQAA